MKLLQKLTFIMKNRRLPDEVRPDDMSSKATHSHGDACCDHGEPKPTGGVCSMDGKCCQEGEMKEAKAGCGDECECEK